MAVFENIKRMKNHNSIVFTQQLIDKNFKKEGLLTCKFHQENNSVQDRKDLHFKD
jgi:hypothetical protein